jgi:hypothetical protein
LIQTISAGWSDHYEIAVLADVSPREALANATIHQVSAIPITATPPIEKFLSDISESAYARDVDIAQLQDVIERTYGERDRRAVVISSCTSSPTCWHGWPRSPTRWASI